MTNDLKNFLTPCPHCLLYVKDQEHCEACNKPIYVNGQRVCG